MATKKKAESKDATMETLTGDAQVRGGARKAAAFPLEEGHYFSLPVTSRSSHSGARGEDANAVRAIQRALGLPETGRFDYTTADTVGRWQKGHNKPVTRTVDKDTWDRLVGGG